MQFCNTHGAQYYRQLHQWWQQRNTANLCAVDLSKAFFDKVNHDALILKLMKRRVPNEL